MSCWGLPKGGITKKFVNFKKRSFCNRNFVEESLREEGPPKMAKSGAFRERRAIPLIFPWRKREKKAK